MCGLRSWAKAVCKDLASCGKCWQVLRLSGPGDRGLRSGFEEYKRLFIFATQEFCERPVSRGAVIT